MLRDKKLVELDSEVGRRWRAIKHQLGEIPDFPQPTCCSQVFEFSWGYWRGELVVMHEPTGVFAYFPVALYTVPAKKRKPYGSIAAWWLAQLQRVMERRGNVTNVSLPPVDKRGTVRVTLYGRFLVVEWEGNPIFIQGDSQHAVGEILRPGVAEGNGDT